MNDEVTRLQQLLHKDVPLTRAMGVKVTHYDGSSLTVEAPLSNNQNHKNTAFGGSLYSLAALSGWGLLHLKMQERGLSGHIVIYEGRVSYKSPVTGDLVARCRLADEAAFERFLKTYARKGMAKIQLASEMPGVSGTAVIFQGTYVVHN